MGKLGVSVYPERSTYDKDAAYLDLAHKYGFKRVFTSLLEINGDQATVLGNFKKVITHANELGMEVMVDMNPSLFKQLGISYNDLKFFHDLGAWGVRLDEGFTGQEEALMTRNEYGLKIEVNMSSGTSYIDNIMSYSPKRENLMGSHNFYPHRYSGLDYDFFVGCTNKYRKYNLNTAAFINSHAATFGPWPTQDGLPTLEEHRDLEIATQVKHYVMADLIDDLLIGNAYASEAELAAVAEAFNADYPSLKVDVADEITDQEKTVLFDNLQSYRGDRSAYLLRSTQTRVKYSQWPFPAHHCVDMVRGDVLIDNVGYGQYKGETEIALLPMKNDGRVNVVGKISADEQFLLTYLKPWSHFKLIPSK
ncbi:outer surface protein [Lactobacillus selangorensis]|uniref:Outer surface protein n=1 Tax=Lactobacillus selangorensis TaxID=81857 RepID=A0A0R2G744_9LACO|nr:MupG family TIM beta-alpha barrel fold protein [Lactobacillus selangorensis]KRN29418.1 outer surface protein [Lactobacillus selangorensis]KRN34053.1 outer surface protein [Lactobacillus selangorensis]